MECKFFVGQKVVCVDALPVPGCGYPDREIFPIAGEIYTIREVLVNPRGLPVVYLAEIVNPKLKYVEGYKEKWFLARRFRPATDITQFHKLVEEARKHKRVTVDA